MITFEKFFSALLLAVLLWMRAGVCGAYELGEIEVHNPAKEKFRAELQLRLSEQEEIRTVRVGSAADYKELQMPHPWAVKSITVTTNFQDRGATIRFVSSKPLPRQKFSLLVLISSSKKTDYHVFTIAPDGVKAPPPPVVAEATGKGDQETADVAPRRYGPVRKGQSLKVIAKAVRPDGVTLAEMMSALYKKNPDRFRPGKKQTPIPGGYLIVPSPDEIKADRVSRKSVAETSLPPVVLPVAPGDSETPAPSAPPAPSESMDKIVDQMRTRVDELARLTRESREQQAGLEERLTNLENAPLGDVSLEHRVVALELAMREPPPSGEKGSMVARGIDLAQSWLPFLLVVAGVLFVGGMAWSGRRWNRWEQWENLEGFLKDTAQHHPVMMREALIKVKEHEGESTPHEG
ncbi:MAG: hypothetical protein HQM03_10940 [Magnetococcales bacterium]|nr:hypothetical protein [Magnetococcales bacterium]